MTKISKGNPPLLSIENENGFDLWQEHMRGLRSWDDLSLVRWLSQSLGQFYERSWRVSHSFVVAYRLGVTVAHQRDVWNRRIFSFHQNYQTAPCCNAPTIPLVSFEMMSHGIACSCCGGELISLKELPLSLRKAFMDWGRRYDSIHQVAHWDDERKKESKNYDKDFDEAGDRAIPLLTELGYKLVPKLLELYPAIFWEDGDHCLDLRPEEIPAPTG